jgi:hypothetical protein
VAVAIEHHPDGYLFGGKAQEIDRGKKTEVGSPERQIRCQLAGDQGVDGPKRVRKVKPGRERQEDEDDQTPKSREVFCRRRGTSRQIGSGNRRRAPGWPASISGMASARATILPFRKAYRAAALPRGSSLFWLLVGNG